MSDKCDMCLLGLITLCALLTEAAVTASETVVCMTAGSLIRVIVIIVEIAVFAAPTVILLQIICVRRAEYHRGRKLPSVGLLYSSTAGWPHSLAAGWPLSLAAGLPLSLAAGLPLSLAACFSAGSPCFAACFAAVLGEPPMGLAAERPEIPPAGRNQSQTAAARN
ncbi:hypothetical protein G5714_007534 [Onychostoma macrolepis]|uniref:Uncharacterized protein n=1 Tax=Onychostoma macrolepis TaxID=369639 RepID=A0A7J6CVB9_9TELE|nr:hypothetical protein G5714_007534 [Onychostoma macrolepis]